MPLDAIFGQILPLLEVTLSKSHQQLVIKLYSQFHTDTGEEVPQSKIFLLDDDLVLIEDVAGNTVPCLPVFAEQTNQQPVEIVHQELDRVVPYLIRGSEQRSSHPSHVLEMYGYRLRGKNRVEILIIALLHDLANQFLR